MSGRDLDTAIKSHSADVNTLDRGGKSPLEYAIIFGDINNTRTLLTQGANPNLSDGKLICQALRVSKHRLEILELLFRFGASIDGFAGDNVADHLIHTSGGRWDANTLAVDKLLIEHGLDVNHQLDHLSGGLTLIMFICLYKSDEKSSIGRIEQLLSFGASTEIRDRWGYTALEFAIYRNFIGALKVLLHAGARLDVKTGKGDTIIHLAVISGRSNEFVKAISEIDLTALDLNLRNEDGHTAYDLLRKRNGLKWENYCEQWLESTEYWYLHQECDSLEIEYQVILALETLLHQIQTSQGIPQDQQYPPLGDFLCDDKDEEPVPGAWPV